MHGSRTRSPGIPVAAATAAVPKSPLALLRSAPSKRGPGRRGGPTVAPAQRCAGSARSTARKSRPRRSLSAPRSISTRPARGYAKGISSVLEARPCAPDGAARQLAFLRLASATAVCPPSVPSPPVRPRAAMQGPRSGASGARLHPCRMPGTPMPSNSPGMAAQGASPGLPPCCAFPACRPAEASSSIMRCPLQPGSGIKRSASPGPAGLPAGSRAIMPAAPAPPRPARFAQQEAAGPRPAKRGGRPGRPFNAAGSHAVSDMLCRILKGIKSAYSGL